MEKQSGAQHCCEQILPRNKPAGAMPRAGGFNNSDGEKQSVDIKEYHEWY